MKIRKGFVSNSSSSSFVCDLTGEVFTDYDSSLRDYELAQCENGHTFLYYGFSVVEEWIDSDDNEESNYEMPSTKCPICNHDPKATKQLVDRFSKEFKRLGLSVGDFK